MRRLAVCAWACLLLAGCADAPVPQSSLPTPESQRATAAPTTTETTTPPARPTASPSASAREVALGIERPRLLRHLEQLQRIADDREGNRATGTAACDTIDNVELATLEEMTQAIAHALVSLAYREF